MYWTKKSLPEFANSDPHTITRLWRQAFELVISQERRQLKLLGAKMVVMAAICGTTTLIDNKILSYALFLVCLAVGMLITNHSLISLTRPYVQTILEQESQETMPAIHL